MRHYSQQFLREALYRAVEIHYKGNRKNFIFVHTFWGGYAIIIDVTPPIHYPIRNEIPSPEKPGFPAGLFTAQKWEGVDSGLPLYIFRISYTMKNSNARKDLADDFSCIARKSLKDRL